MQFEVVRSGMVGGMTNERLPTWFPMLNSLAAGVPTSGREVARVGEAAATRSLMANASSSASELYAVSMAALKAYGVGVQRGGGGGGSWICYIWLPVDFIYPGI